MLFAVLRVREVERLRILPTDRNIRALLTVVTICVSVRDRTLRANGLVRVRERMVVCIIFDRLRVRNFRLLIIDCRLGVNCLYVFLRERRRALLILALLTSTVRAIIVTRREDLLNVANNRATGDSGH